MPVAAPRPQRLAGLETYSPTANWRPGNNFGGNVVFKALTHPLVIPKVAALQAHLAGKRVAVYDPVGHFAPFNALFGLPDSRITACYTQNVQVGAVDGQTAQPITAFDPDGADTLLVAAFDAARAEAQLKPLLPANYPVVTLDALRIPDDWLTNPKRYLDPLNFCINSVLWQHGGGRYTVLSTANYWGEYGNVTPRFWVAFFTDAGEMVRQGWLDLAPEKGAGVRLDSRDICEQFGITSFSGTLYLHVVGTAGHDILKYGLDFIGPQPEQLTATHDSNPWPAELYAGIPAPTLGEVVTLELQNALPLRIPAGTIGVRPMGREGETVWLARELAPFGTLHVTVNDLFPGLQWPGQLELVAQKTLTRPRYTIRNQRGHSRIGHANVKRTDLQPDPVLSTLEPVFGNGFILPLPVLPLADFVTDILPTPMSTAQTALPLQAIIFDAKGQEVARMPLGVQAADAVGVLPLSTVLQQQGISLDGQAGQVQLAYDFSHGMPVDGWLHAIARYRHRRTGHVAETSFGAHIFNSAAVYKGEPQSYSSAPPGVTTRLFLRMVPGHDSWAVLMYPVSKQWWPQSDTRLILRGSRGETVAERQLVIPANGCAVIRVSALFTDAERQAAGEQATVVIRDTTCRLFGYGGLDDGRGHFSFDHLFGF